MGCLILQLVVVGVLSSIASTSQAAAEDPLALEWPRLPETSLEDDYETLPFPHHGQGSGDGFVQWSLRRAVPSTGRNYTIHVGSLSSGLPNTFSFQLPEGGQTKNINKWLL